MSKENKKPGQKKRPLSATKKKLVARLGKEAAKKTYRLAVISRNMLKSRMDVQTFSEVLAEARTKRIAQALVRSSRKKYLEAISLALALYYAAQATDDPTAKLEKLVEETGQRVTKRTTAAQIVVRVVIDYGSSDEERRANRKFASRDAAAVEHLIEHGISPNQVVECGKKKGQGLEAWGTAKPRRKPAPTRPRTAPAKKPWAHPDEIVKKALVDPEANAKEPWDEREEKHEPQANQRRPGRVYRTHKGNCEDRALVLLR